MAFELPLHLPRRQQLRDPTTELLAVIASEPHESLTASRTGQWLAELDTCIWNTMDDIHTAILNSSSQFSKQMEVAQSVQGGAADIERQVQETTSYIRSPDHLRALTPAQTGLISSLTAKLEHHSKLAQETYNRNLASHSLSFLLAQMQDCTVAADFVSAGNLIEAQSKCEELKLRVEEGIPMPLANTKTFNAFKKRLRSLSDRIQEQLSLAYRNAIQIREAAGAISLSIQTHLHLANTDSTIPLASLLSALGTASLDAHLMSFRKDLVSRIIDPVISSVYSIEVETDAVDIKEMHLNASAKEHMPLAHLGALVRFLSDHLFSSLPPRQRTSFAASLYSPLSSAVLERLIKSHIPNSIASVPQFLDLLENAVEFETSITALGFGSKDDIRKWVAVAHVHYERHRLEAYIQEARELIQKATLHDVVTVEEPADLGSSSSSAVSDRDPEAWSFDDDVQEEQEDNWGFDNDVGDGAPSSSNDPESSRELPKESNPTEEEADGWEWDDEDDAEDIVPLSVTVSRDTEVAVPKAAKRLEKLSSRAKTSGDQVLPSLSTSVSTPSSHSQPSIPYPPPLKQAKEVTQATPRRHVVSTTIISLALLLSSAEQEMEQLKNTDVFSRIIRDGKSESGIILGITAPTVLDMVCALYPVQRDERIGTFLLQSNDFRYLTREARKLKINRERSMNQKEIDRWTESINSLVTCAQEVLDDALDVEIGKLDDILARARGFVDISDDVRYHECAVTVQHLLKHVRIVAQEWKDLLPQEQYFLALGTVVNAALVGLVDSIVALQDITEKESERLAELCKELEPVQDLFSDDSQESPVGRYVPSWFRYSYLGELLVASIADISYLFNEGTLVDYEVSEIVSLLRALFAETQLRESTIRRIEQGHPHSSNS